MKSTGPLSRSARLTLAALAFAFSLTAPRASAAAPPARPSILWITCEDMSPNLGCYGDTFAVTPNLDRLAASSVRYANCFAIAGVCAPSRSALITGMYPSSLGSQHMRCTTTLPTSVNAFPAYLRAAGYYCSNNAKQDYNFATPKEVWDESSGKAHWRKRRPGQPFFSVFNLMVTHESRIRAEPESRAELTKRLTPEQRHDPAKVTVPPWHPDTPAVRRDWANYYDLITAADYQVADLLAQLQADGLADDTLVFFFSDHGAGLPRAKQWIFEAGLQVPLLIHFPEKWRHLAPAAPGSVVEQLVSLVDFAPSVLSLVGERIPAHMQGVPFLGTKAGAPRPYVFGIRDRMDERVDMMRSVRDERFKYHRNYLPHLPFAQPIEYMDLLPTMKELRRLSAVGQLMGAAAHFMAPTKPAEELYDLRTDPHETRNLAGVSEHEPVLKRMREAHLKWARDTRDLSLLPEAEMRARSEGSSPYEIAQRAETFPLERLLQTAELTRHGVEALPKMVDALKDSDSAVRYWGASALIALGTKAQPAADALANLLTDSSPNVRIAAAHALCKLGRERDAVPVLAELLTDTSEWVRVAAVNVLDLIDEQARPALAALRKATSDKSIFVRDPAGRALLELTPNGTVSFGAARVDITPQEPLRLCGYASRTTPFEGVAERLRAGAFAFGSDAEGASVLITAELIGAPADIVEPVAKRLQKKAGIPRERIAFCATHTHTGPVLSAFLKGAHFAEPLPAEELERLHRYEARLIDQLEKVALEALAVRRPAQLSWSQGSVGFAANRRFIQNGKYVGMKASDGPVDHALPVLIARDGKGALIAVLANYACHCTTYSAKFNRVHGDWAGAAVRMIEQRHPGTVALMAIGCGGDANPNPRGANDGFTMVDAHGKAVADEVGRLLALNSKPLHSTPACQLKRIELPFDHVPTREELLARVESGGRPAHYARILLDRIGRGESIPAAFSYPVQTWAFGDDLAMVFLSGEVLVDYSLRLKRELDSSRLWVTAYANDMPGYIASKRVIQEGGYEVDDSMNNYDKPTRLALGAEDLIINAAKSLTPPAFASAPLRRMEWEVGGRKRAALVSVPELAGKTEFPAGAAELIMRFFKQLTP